MYLLRCNCHNNVSLQSYTYGNELIALACKKKADGEYWLGRSGMSMHMHISEDEVSREEAKRICMERGALYIGFIGDFVCGASVFLTSEDFSVE